MDSGQDGAATENIGKDSSGFAKSEVVPGEHAAAPGEDTSAPVEPAAPVVTASAPQNALDEDWRNELLAALHETEPHISNWLDIILRDTPEAGPVLWERLSFLFAALDIPPGEAETFVTNIQDWLAKTGNETTADFRSDLQYRLALALNMEEAPEEKTRFWHKLFQGLARTRNSIAGGFYELFNGPGELDDNFWDELEELLITADVGMEAAGILLDRLKKEARKSNASSRQDMEALFIAAISAIFKSSRKLRTPERPEVVLMVGVNGAGKTTTIAKLAYRAKLQGRKVLLAAADTFRAAAIEQLETWADRVGVGFYAKAPGDDPAAVAFEAMDRAAQNDVDLVFVDTAGRLQTKTNLMEELGKINRILNKKVPGAPHRCVLVLDANTGQNALSQVKLFNQASRVDEIILSKLDGTAKGGVAVGIALEFDIPISFIGLGEKMEDLRPFDPQTFAKALLGLDAPGV
jgi:fused signal recognition particle receptor